MLCDHAQGPPRFADLHPTILALADGIEKHDDFTAVASSVNVRPVPALATSVNPSFETVDSPLAAAQDRPFVWGDNHEAARLAEFCNEADFDIETDAGWLTLSRDEDGFSSSKPSTST